MSYDYKILTPEDRSRLRIERVRALEAEIYRAELALEDALSSAERDAIMADIQVIHRRLEPHYARMGLVEPPGEQGGSGDDDGPQVVPPDQLRTVG